MPTYRSLDFLGYPKYRVGDDGSVWSFRCTDDTYKGKWRRRWRWKRLKTPPDNNGYPLAGLYRNNVNKTFTVHRLVLLAFVGPCPEGMECRHFPDRNPGNCKLSNLSWATEKTNQNDRKVHGTAYRGEKHHLAIMTADKVRLLRKLRKRGMQFKDLACKFGISISAASLIVYRINWKHID